MIDVLGHCAVWGEEELGAVDATKGWADEWSLQMDALDRRSRILKTFCDIGKGLNCRSRIGTYHGWEVARHAVRKHDRVDSIQGGRSDLYSGGAIHLQVA